MRVFCYIVDVNRLLRQVARVVSMATHNLNHLILDASVTLRELQPVPLVFRAHNNGIIILHDVRNHADIIKRQVELLMLLFICFKEVIQTMLHIGMPQLGNRHTPLPIKLPPPQPQHITQPLAERLIRTPHSSSAIIVE